MSALKALCAHSPYIAFVPPLVRNIKVARLCTAKNIWRGSIFVAAIARCTGFHWPVVFSVYSVGAVLVFYILREPFFVLFATGSAIASALK